MTSDEARATRRPRRGPDHGGLTMSRWIIKTSLKFRYLVVRGRGLMLFGSARSSTTQVDVFPEFAPPRVEIQTTVLGLTPTEVEELVTVPLEQALGASPGLDIIRSKSVPSSSSIELLFEPRHRSVPRPPARPGAHGRGARPAAHLGGTAGHAPAALRDEPGDEDRASVRHALASSCRRSRTGRSAPGCSGSPASPTSRSGASARGVQVQTDPAKLVANNVSLERVMTDTAERSTRRLLRFTEGRFVGTGGFIDTPNQRLDVEHKLAIRTPEDLARCRSPARPARRQPAHARRRRHREGRPSAAASATRSSTAGPVCCSSSRSSRSPTRSTSPRTSRTRSRT